VILLWIGVLQLLPGPLLTGAMPYLLMADLEFMMFFSAGALFFEKGERTLFALQITPMRFRHYLASKLGTMSALALVTCVVVVLAHAGAYDTGVEPLALLAAVVLMALLMVLAGIITAPLFPSISEWLVPSTVLIAVANAPALDYSGLVPHPLLHLVPTEGPLLLLGSAFGQVTLAGWQVAYAIGYPALWVAGLCLLARCVFDRYVVTREGAA
jgi:fluoroquinolone transport system permease protein